MPDCCAWLGGSSRTVRVRAKVVRGQREPLVDWYHAWPVTVVRQRARLVELLGAPLLDSPWLARLGHISFLGTLDRHPRSRRASTRLEHSLGVATLAADAAVALDLPPARARLV